MEKFQTAEILRISRMIALIGSAILGYVFGYSKGNYAISLLFLFIAVTDWVALSIIINKLENDPNVVNDEKEVK